MKWKTYGYCDECQRRATVVVRMNEEDELVEFCGGCLRKAVALADEGEESWAESERVRE